jgi:hypothetical protein
MAIEIENRSIAKSGTTNLVGIFGEQERSAPQGGERKRTRLATRERGT